jgi:hypothetical protein
MLLRGTLVSFDSGTWRAVVRLDSSAPQALTGVAVSRALASGEMVANRRVLLAPGDHGDVADIVVIAVW